MYARGKGIAHPTLEQWRIIMPLMSWWSLTDIVLARRLRTFIDTRLPPLPDWGWEGAVPKTQPTECAAWVMLVCDELRDTEMGAAAGLDIRQFYDSIDVVLACRTLLEWGAPQALAKALLLHQATPASQVAWGSGLREPSMASARLRPQRADSASGLIEEMPCATAQASRRGFSSL